MEDTIISLPIHQRIVSLDATILNTFQNCAYKTNLSFVQNLQTLTKGEALEEGDLFHKMLETYYGLKYKIARFTSDLWETLSEAGFEFKDLAHDEPPEDEDEYRERVIDFCCKVGTFFATKMDTDPQELEEVIYQFRAYVDFYKHDPWHPLAVEEIGSKLLFEDEDWKIIYNCKTDLVAEKGNLICPWDHKTGRRRSTPNSLSNQFIGTCYVLGFNDILINKIGFQKSLSSGERFQRFLLKINDSRIQEWRANTIWWAMQLYNCLTTDSWPRNLTSCDKYSGCIYAPICEASPENRESKIQSLYKLGTDWDVAKVLEGI